MNCQQVSDSLSIVAATSLYNNPQLPLCQCCHTPPLLLLRALHVCLRVRSLAVSTVSLDLAFLRSSFLWLFVSHSKSQKPSDRDLSHEASVDRSYHRSTRHCINQPSEGLALPARLCLQKVPRTINRGLFCQSSLWFWFCRLACHWELRLSDIAPVQELNSSLFGCKVFCRRSRNYSCLAYQFEGSWCLLLRCLLPVCSFKQNPFFCGWTNFWRKGETCISPTLSARILSCYCLMSSRFLQWLKTDGSMSFRSLIPFLVAGSWRFLLILRFFLQ